MLPFRKILCPTDFSEPSYEALKAAGELAHHFGAELCIVHVISPVPIMPVGAEPTAFNVGLYEQELMASSRKSLEEVLSHLETKEVRARLIVVRGNPADEIASISDEEHVDLIVIATRGRTGLDRLIFGSVAEKVVRLARCPVLTVTGQPDKEESVDKAENRSRSAEGKHAKSNYQEKIEAQMKEWGVQIALWKAKAEESTAEAKAAYLKQIEELKNKEESAKHKLRELKESGGEAWEEVKVGLEKALEDLKQAFNLARGRFKGK
jgi:nucleotide-binding universal stress UspA family protein